MFPESAPRRVFHAFFFGTSGEAREFFFKNLGTKMGMRCAWPHSRNFNYKPSGDSRCLARNHRTRVYVGAVKFQLLQRGSRPRSRPRSQHHRCAKTRTRGPGPIPPFGPARPGNLPACEPFGADVRVGSSTMRARFAVRAKGGSASTMVFDLLPSAFSRHRWRVVHTGKVDTAVR